MVKRREQSSVLFIVLILLFVGAVGLLINFGGGVTGDAVVKAKPDFCTPAGNECQLREFSAEYDGSKWNAKIICNLNPGQNIQSFTTQLTQLDLMQMGKIRIPPGTWTSVDPVKNTAMFSNTLDSNNNYINKMKMRYDPNTGLLSLDIKGTQMNGAPFPNVLPSLDGQLDIGGLPLLFGSTPANNGPTVVKVDIMMTLR